LGGIMLPRVVKSIVFDLFCLALEFTPVLLLALTPALAVSSVVSPALTRIVLAVVSPVLIFGLFSSMIDQVQ